MLTQSLTLSVVEVGLNYKESLGSLGWKFHFMDKEDKNGQVKSFIANWRNSRRSKRKTFKKYLKNYAIKITRFKKSYIIFVIIKPNHMNVEKQDKFQV